MSGLRRGRESGVTLVEFMIGLGLLSLISYAVTHFFSKVTQSDAELSAKGKAQSELAYLSSLLEKDLKFRDINNLAELCTTASCRQINFTRLASGGGTYAVTYESQCRNLPAGTLSGLRFNLANTECIQALNCPAGQYPSLTITTTNPVSTKIIPDFTTPVGQKRAVYNVVGVALCATRSRTQNIAAPTPHTVSQDRILLEGAFLGANRVIRVERKETIFSSNNMAKIQMLPN